jgi:hypothetical protein
MFTIDQLSTDGTLPPTDLSPPLQALWWLKKGGLKMGPEWHKAHAICQTAEGTHAHDLVHALAHWIEGDDGNAAYWYRRVGGGKAATIAAEWERIAAEFA